MPENFVVWAGYPLGKGAWEPEAHFNDQAALKQQDIDNRLIPEDKLIVWRTKLPSPRE